MPVVTRPMESAQSGSKTVGGMLVAIVALAVVAALVYAYDRLTGPPSTANDTLTLWTALIVAWAVLLLAGVVAIIAQLAGIRRALECPRG